MFSGAEADGFTTDGDKIEEAAKSVLKLYVYDSGNADLNHYYATGSGFVAFDNSTLITNYHVIDGAEMIIAMDDQDYVYNLKYVMCADQVYDIAILAFEKPTSLKPLELYPDDKLKRGSSIIAIGSPKETKNTVSRGIISNTYYYNDVPEIQIDAAISPGSSGGALFNDDGKVIGVTSSGYRTKDEYGQDTQAQNINFAINSAVPQAMYNAWDGIRHTLSDHIDTAEMDFSNVYDHQTGMTDISEIKKAEDISLEVSKQVENKPDFAIFWDKDIYLAKRLEQNGIRLFNNSAAVELCDNKILMYQELAKNNIRVPRTFIAPKTFEGLGYNKLSFLDKVIEEIGFPIVIKEAYGSFGEQVYLASDKESAKSIIKRIGYKDFLMQEFIASSKGRDIRINVVGDKAIASMLRENKNDFRSNISSGGNGINYEPKQAFIDLTIKAAKALGLSFAGVDVMFGEDGPIICEVNSNPQFASTLKATGINLGEFISDYILKQL